VKSNQSTNDNQEVDDKDKSTDFDVPSGEITEEIREQRYKDKKEPGYEVAPQTPNTTTELTKRDRSPAAPLTMAVVLVGKLMCPMERMLKIRKQCLIDSFRNQVTLKDLFNIPKQENSCLENGSTTHSLGIRKVLIDLLD
jgi:hypothetical protein